MLVLYQWLFAHLLADFGLQTSKMIQHKKRLKERSWVLYAHALLHGILVYVFSPDKTIWLIPVIVFITHFFIDLWKLYRKDTAVVFILDQILHIIVLVILWLIYYQPVWLHIKFMLIVNDQKVWLITAGYMVIIFPLAYILGYATSKWRCEIETITTRSAISLSEAGKWIGIFERILVFTFVIVNHFEGIGFLIAAKSILRYSDIKGDGTRKEAEYILIGTLMSFASSILVGLAVRSLIA